MEELKHCPFCCGEGKVIHADKGRYYEGFAIRCSGCGMRTDCMATKDQASEAWNRRDHQACTA